MFTDPQSITINAVAQSLAKITTDGMKSVYKTADGVFTFTISHQETGKPGTRSRRIRTMVRLDQRAVVTDPLTSENDYDTLTEYYVIDRPEVGFTSTQVDQLGQGLKTWLSTTNFGKLYGGES